MIHNCCLLLSLLLQFTTADNASYVPLEEDLKVDLGDIMRESYFNTLTEVAEGVAEVTDDECQLLGQKVAQEMERFSAASGQSGW
ncbi:unnamed protein product [Gongylonema pulchrum]|uniref:Secreted protein n=1 Tax=Gongylonema pulchrum TaxID=637853 RepID=A0A183DJ68_9BILA|nr:unnamed protein product [Gongylonema pulchrum]